MQNTENNYLYQNQDIQIPYKDINAVDEVSKLPRAKKPKSKLMLVAIILLSIILILVIILFIQNSTSSKIQPVVGSPTPSPSPIVVSKNTTELENKVESLSENVRTIDLEELELSFPKLEWEIEIK